MKSPIHHFFYGHVIALTSFLVTVIDGQVEVDHAHGSHEFITNQGIDHLKEHLSEEIGTGGFGEQMTNLQEDNYYFMLADTDHDLRLDGLDILKWIYNDHESHGFPMPSVATLESTADEFLKLCDFDDDGLIDFWEFKTYRDEDRKKNASEN